MKFNNIKSISHELSFKQILHNNIRKIYINENSICKIKIKQDNYYYLYR